MNKIRENLNRFLTCTAYRGDKPVCTWAKCDRNDDTYYWQTVEHDELTGPEMEPADLAESLAIIEGTGCRLDFNNHSAA